MNNLFEIIGLVINILIHLDIKDVLSFRSTCTRFIKAFDETQYLWTAVNPRNNKFLIEYIGGEMFFNRNLSAVKFFLQAFRITRDNFNDLNIILEEICIDGNLPLLKLMWSTLQLSKSDFRIDEHLYIICENNIQVAQWLVDEVKIDISDEDVYSALNTACCNGQVEPIKWIVTRFAISIEIILYGNVIYGGMFPAACSMNHIRVAQLLANLYDLKLSPQWRKIILEEIITLDSNGGFHMFKWFIKRFAIIRSDIESAFESIISRVYVTNNIHFIKWVSKRLMVTQQDANMWARQRHSPVWNAYNVGRLSVIQWLVKRYELKRYHFWNGVKFIGGIGPIDNWLDEYYKTHE